MKKRKIMHHLRHRQTRQLLLIGTVLVLVFLVLAMFFRTAESNQPQRLVTFYDRGHERSILTRATTVQGALKSADIEVDPHDIIEPSIGSALTKSYVDVIIYRSRPVAVVDGAVRQTVMTSLQSANEIVKEAGLEGLDSKDTSKFQQGSRIHDGALTELIVSRVKKEVIAAAPVPRFEPKQNALTSSKGAHVYIDINGVAHRETYYDLPMNRVILSCGAANTYSVRSDGAKIDQDGYILVAANLAAYPRCSVVDTSMGPGKVYDTGGFVVRHPYGFDLATDWSRADGI